MNRPDFNLLLPGAALLMSVLVLGTVSARHFGGSDTVANTAPEPVTISPTGPSGSDIGVLAARDPFAASNRTQQPVITQPVRRTPLPSYALRGILYLADDNGGAAMIGTDRQQAAPYRAGDRLPGGATLKSISPSGITIAFQGETREIALPRAAMGQARADARRPVPTIAARIRAKRSIRERD